MKNDCLTHFQHTLWWDPFVGVLFVDAVVASCLYTASIKYILTHIVYVISVFLAEDQKGECSWTYYSSDTQQFDTQSATAQQRIWRRFEMVFILKEHSVECSVDKSVSNLSLIFFCSFYWHCENMLLWVLYSGRLSTVLQQMGCFHKWFVAKERNKGRDRRS